MDIQVAEFRKVLTLVRPAVPRKTSLPILKNILLKDGQALATDLETFIAIPVPEADVSCVLPYADVVKMLQYTNGGELLHIEPGAGKVLMTWPEGSSTFISPDAKDFPDLPEFVPVSEAELDGDTLFPAMLSVLPYIATDASRPVLSGLTLVMGEPIEVAAGDGFRMAYQTVPLSFPQNVTVLVPLSSVSALYHLWEKTPRTPPSSEALIPVIMAKKQVSVAFNGTTGLRFVFGQSATAIVKLIEGNPPAWLKLVPKGEPVLTVQLMAADLALAVRRVLGIASAEKGIVRLAFDDGTATISAKADDQEVVSRISTLTTKGAPNRVALQVSYLLDYLTGKDGIVTITWTGDTAPVVLQHQKNPKVLIMPMNVQWEEQPESVEPEAEDIRETVAEEEAPPEAEEPQETAEE